MKCRQGLLTFWGCVALLAMHSGCTPDERALNDPEALAVYKGGSISAQDLDAAILELPPAQRRVAPDEAMERNRMMVRGLVVNRLLGEQAKAEGVDQNQGFLEIHEENRQRIVSDHFIQARSAAIPDLTPEDVSRYYDEHREEFNQEERRLTSHIFRRAGGPAIETAASELSGLRERVLRGESFGALAEQYSDSETAHGLGELGWLSRDSIPADLAGVIFSLEPGVPSEPIVTGDGVHLFMVNVISAARDFSLSDVEGQVAAALRIQRRQEYVSAMVEELPLPDPYYVPRAEDVQLLVGSGDPHAEVFRVGESSLTVERFRQLMERSSAAASGNQAADLPEVLLQALVQRARIYEHCRVEGVLDEPVLAARLEHARQRDAIAFITERALLLEARREPEMLEEYYQSNRRRFSSPLFLEVSALVLPLPDRGAGTIMDRLALLGHDSADDRLDTAATELGGTVERMGKVTLGSLMRWNSKAARILSAIDVGECSPPIRIGDSIVVIEVTERWEPEPLPFVEVSDQVAWAYITDHRQVMYEQVTTRILDEAGYDPNEEKIEAFSGGDFT